MENIIAKYNIRIDQDPIQGESDVYLVRHAMSEFNMRDLTARSRGETFAQVKSDPALIDAELHAIGLL